MEAAIRFSQTSLPGHDSQHFLKIDIAGQSLQLYNINKLGKNSIRYELIHSSKKLAKFRAFDWHPSEATLVAVGQSGGEAGLVNLAYPDQKPVNFTAKSPRFCNAVALNVSNWIAIGLDKARTDHGLYVWDINHQVNHAGSKTLKNNNKPLHNVASGETVTSLRFFQDSPQILAAGVQGFVRLYDLRESNPSSVLQFATRCINNIAVDTQDENYFASCLQSNTPTVAVWDRRMITRTDAAAQFGFANPVSQAEQQPEVSAELGNLADTDIHIFGLRFSKTHRGHLGVLSSTGQLKIITFDRNEISPTYRQDQQQQQSPTAWTKQEPQDIFVDNVQNMVGRNIGSISDGDDYRLLSFDFTTATSRHGRPTIITLNKRGDISVRPVIVSDSHAKQSSSIMLERYSAINTTSTAHGQSPGSTGHTDDMKQGLLLNDKQLEIFRSLGVPRRRCLSGYLLDATKNYSVAKEDEKLLALWKWLEHTKTISANSALIEGEFDLSYAGICDIWTEEIDLQARSVRGTSIAERPQTSSIIKDAARRLGLIRGKGCSTDYLQHRALCLHVLGLPWLRSDVQKECDRLLSQKQLTKAAAIALFAGEEKIAQRALRAAGSGNGHKMLAMALVSSRTRVHRYRRPSHGSSQSREEASSSSEDSQDDEWQDIISAIAADLTDCYAKSILAFVKTNRWEDVISQDCLPLVSRVMVALRHCDDASLTMLLTKLRTQAVSSGNLEGIVLTGLGGSASIDLLTRHAKLTGDVQTVALAMSFDATFDRFLPRDSPHTRTIHCYREIYKSQLMSYSLKFDKARFNVALSRVIRSHNLATQPRKQEQIRLICSHCNQSLSQFGHEQQVDEKSLSTTLSPVLDISKHAAAPSKAAVNGTICPKCTRHLPRCGVCDMWLGTPDETFSKWYRPYPPPISSHRNSNSNNYNNNNPSGSMIGSTLTTIGPPTINKTPSKQLTTAVQVVDEDIATQLRDRNWHAAMHKFTVFCTRCSHGFHAEHARMWFDGDGEMGGERHRVCPVPSCECFCNA